ncbi:glycosyltransferase family 2 protein [Cryptosporangium arvum]|uniref:Putative glycosyltransferase n=1 Tax=Cryptosporangium arvum DSM 44712 TaxID=927661 RepID=A0A011AIA6_9ACTN|nr:glycosyltransferase [Cryptosporangium arvum]EXG81721.1 putative glycosyltransferase [Cryptosporangium arvum DSM 44712]
MNWSVVIPTIGRPSLAACLDGLAGSVRSPVEVVLVDDRPLNECGPLPVEVPPGLDVRVEYGCGNGPAAARNVGWRSVTTPWVVFLDDDVVPGPAWASSLETDLASADATVGAVPGRIVVPLPGGRRPTDAERTTAGLAESKWITADIAYRVAALAATGGFDERFRRAFREDADLALRVLDAGWSLGAGQRVTTHPVRPDGPLASVRAQAGNADDVLMTRLHGPTWWDRAEAPRGRFTRHLVITAAAATAVTLATAAARRRPGPSAGALRRTGAYGVLRRTCAPGASRGRAGRADGCRRVAAVAAAVWAAGTAEFAAARIAPGPRTGREITTMIVTSVLIPPAAVAHHLRGRWRHRRAGPWSAPAPVSPPPGDRVEVAR